MLKKRIVASLIVKDNIVVQSINFSKYLPVGSVEIAIEFLNQWGIDEIILLDISATKNNTGPNFDLIKKSSAKCRVPLTVGGGITNIDQIKRLMQCGADKISLNKSALNQVSIISEAAKVFGNQCVVASIDVLGKEESYFVYDYVQKQIVSVDPSKLAGIYQDAGAGELFVNSVNRDGSYQGYDIAMLNSICDVVDIPVIGCGGARNAYDLIQVLDETKISGACAANFFHFYEHSVAISKAIISKRIGIRTENFANYRENTVDENCRLLKKSDTELEEMFFIKIDKEVI